MEPPPCGLTSFAQAGTISLVNAYTAVVERCQDTGLYVGYVPDFPERIRKARRSKNFKEIYAR